MAAEYDGDNFRSWDAQWDAPQAAKVVVFSILGAKVGVFLVMAPKRSSNVRLGTQMDKSNPYGLPGMHNGMLNGMQRLVSIEKLSVFPKKNAFEKKSKQAKYSIPFV